MLTPLEFKRIGEELGQLVESKNAAYGSSFAASAKFLELLYPEGVPVAAYQDMLLLVRIFDKQKRIATHKDFAGESPYRDIGGYGIIGAAVDEQKKRDGVTNDTP